MQITVKEWHARFSLKNRETRVVDIVSGSKASQLAAGDLDDVRQVYTECFGRSGRLASRTISVSSPGRIWLSTQAA